MHAIELDGHMWQTLADHQYYSEERKADNNYNS
jgi:hypothetical protein